MSYPFLPGTTFVQPIPRALLDEYFENEESLRRFGLHPANQEIRTKLIARQHEIRDQRPDMPFTDAIPYA